MTLTCWTYADGSWSCTNGAHGGPDGGQAARTNDLGNLVPAGSPSRP